MKHTSEPNVRDSEIVIRDCDSLEVKNAHLNLSRLGAIVRRYVPNQYGISSSPLHRGLPTDRLVAEWWLKSPRVVALTSGGTLPKQDIRRKIAVPLEATKHG